MFLKIVFNSLFYFHVKERTLHIKHATPYNVCISFYHAPTTYTYKSIYKSWAIFNMQMSFLILLQRISKQMTFGPGSLLAKSSILYHTFHLSLFPEF